MDYGIVQEEKMQGVKEEPVYDDSVDTSEAALTELYADHVVKDELVLGPERPHRPDVGLVVCDWALGDADGCPLALDRGGAQLARVCSERLERCNDATSHHVPGETTNTQILAERASPRQKHTDTLQHEAKYVCDCGEIFQQKHNVMEHKKLHQLKGSDIIHERSKIISKRPYVCDICKRAFKRMTHLENHKVIHTGEKPYTCEICKKSFTQLTSLHQHYKLHTGEKPYACETCGKQFTKSSNLNAHRQIHNEHKQLFPCEICKKQFHDLSTVKKHKIIHTGEKAYQCNVCKKQFSYVSYLNKHKIIHTDEKPYQCEFCKKQFRDLSSVKKHKRIHSDEKPHQCELCKKGFIRLSQLNVHKRVHTGEKPYQCELCKKQFRDLSAVNKHKRIHNGKKIKI